MLSCLKKELPKILKQNPNLHFLEIGAGSGINLQTAKSLGVKNIFAIDINPKALSNCKILGFNCVKSNLFSNIKKIYPKIAMRYTLLLYNRINNY